MEALNQLQELKQLFDNGTISESEYLKLKTDLLSPLNTPKKSKLPIWIFLIVLMGVLGFVIYETSHKKSDTSSWIDDFEKLKTAITNSDKKTIKQFFNFPISSSNNHIWALTNDASIIQMIGIDPIKPFTENDFDNYYNELFPKEFSTLISKVSGEKLLKTQTDQVSFFKNGITYSLFLKAVDKDKLYINFSKKNGEEDEGVSHTYSFNIFNNTIKFEDCQIAG